MLCTFRSTHLFNFATWESIYSLFPFNTLYSDSSGHLSVSTVAEYKLYLAEVQSDRVVGDQWTYRVLFSDLSVIPDHNLAEFCFRVVDGRVQFLVKDEHLESYYW